MNIRPALKTDACKIIKLLDQLGYSVPAGFLQHRLAHLITEPDYVNLVYEIAGEPLAFICMHLVYELDMAGDTAIITWLVVDEKHRGEGIGHRLEETCLSIAKQRGCARMQSHCPEFRKAAHLFYESMGYLESPKYFSKEIED